MALLPIADKENVVLTPVSVSTWDIVNEGAARIVRNCVLVLKQGGIAILEGKHIALCNFVVRKAHSL